jgi:hypothetical protein
MNKPEIIAALRAAIALLEDGAPKAAARPTIERRPAEPVATDDERRSFRAGRCRYWNRGETRNGKPRLRIGLEWCRPNGETAVEYWDSYEPSVLAEPDVEVGSEIHVQLKPWKDTFVVIGVQVMGQPPRGGCGFEPDDEPEIPF